MLKNVIYIVVIIILVGTIPNRLEGNPSEKTLDNTSSYKHVEVPSEAANYTNLITPNLTFDSYSFNQDCSQLNVTFCNTGTVVYDASEFYLSFYDANPIESTIDKVQSVIANLNDAIGPGECFQIKLFNGKDLIENKLFYGFINNNNTSAAPFDFENDFPNTAYAENNYLDNLILLDFSVCDNPVVEICDNLIDDDGDGLIDAFDPDCECNNEEANVKYIDNPGFEEHNGCCSRISLTESCVKSWEIVGGAPQYYGVDCVEDTQISYLEEFFVKKFDDSFISLGIPLNFSETVGACLIEPLNAGETYKIEISISFPSQIQTDLLVPKEFTIYGFSDACPDFPTLLGSTLNFCETSLPVQGEQLISIESDDILSLEFTTFTSNYIPISDINYIILSIDCDYDDANNSGSTFFQITSVQITAMEKAPWEFNEEITVTNPCDNSVLLSVPFSDTLSYQWYQDSTPIVGEASSILEVSENNNGFSKYHVFVYNGNGCTLVGPANINLDNCNAPNFSFDSYGFNQDCSTLSITFCNTGSVPFVNNVFFMTLYDVNPLENMSQMAYHLVVNLKEDIEPGECFTTILFKIDAIWNANMLYGFINDNNSTPTPFDLLNDFPSTGFYEADYLDNLFLLDFSVCNNPVVEICDNLLDDDGDGFIDAFDPDCECNNEEVNVKYIDNPGFEEYSVCCSVIPLNGSCVESWEAIGGTADYYGVDCKDANEVSSIEEVHVTKFDDSFISLGTANNFSETMGTCLIEPLKAGDTYVVEISLSFPTELLVTLVEPINFTIYGFSDACPDFSTILGSTINFCQSAFPDQGEQLITITSDDILNLEFTTYISTYIPSSDINYIILSIDCDDDNTGSTFFQIADVQISAMEKTFWLFDETISVSDPYEDLVTLSVPFSQSLNYQWYQDSIPLIGEESSSLEIQSSDTGFSNYHVFVFNDNGCPLLGPAIFDLDNCSKPNLTFDEFKIINNCTDFSFTICNTGNVVYPYDIIHISLYEKNPIENMAKQVITFVIPVEEVIEQGECINAISVGGNLSFYPDTLYGFINDNSSASTPFDFENDFPSTDFVEVNYLDNLFLLNLSDCDQPIVEICDNNIDDDGDGLIDVFDDDCGCLSSPNNLWTFDDTISVSNICKNPISLSLPSSDTLNFQWYQDSTPMNGKVESALDINNLNNEFTDFHVLVYNDNGCRLIGPSIFNLIEIPPTKVTVSICEGLNYPFGDEILTKSGVYYDTLKSQMGCDSVIELTLIVSDNIGQNISMTICEGDTYFFGKEDIGLAGVYIDTLSNIAGCHIIQILNLEVKDILEFSFQDSFCTGEFYSFEGRDIFEAGVYNDTLKNSGNCDSLVTVTLVEIAIPELFIERDICEGDELRYGSQVFSEKGDYSLNIKAENGCDSLLHLSINVQEMIIGDTTFVKIMEGEPYRYNGEDYENEGLYEVIIPSATGCDSMAILSLSINKEVYIPNVFSTTSIIGNDHFKIFSSSNLMIHKYKIFDRWGNVVFTNENFRISDGKENFWDGYCSGQLASKGVYIYYIEYELRNDAPKILTGSMTLL